MEPKSEHRLRRNLQVLSSGRCRHGCTTARLDQRAYSRPRGPAGDPASRAVLNPPQGRSRTQLRRYLDA
jgi:hypothetical protein